MANAVSGNYCQARASAPHALARRRAARALVKSPPPPHTLSSLALKHHTAHEPAAALRRAHDRSHLREQLYGEGSGALRPSVPHLPAQSPGISCR